MLHQITVEFDPQTEGFSFQPEEIHIPQGRHDIMFRLETAGKGGDRARFDADQGVHVKNGENVFENGARGPFRWIEIDHNQATVETRYDYFVTVIYDGRTIASPDPFIVNDPPV